MCECVCFLLVSVPLPLCPGLSSSPTVCEFIHRKCRRALRVAGLMRSDVASPASRELSMSGRSARGKQTVDKIFNTALPVHGSNTSGKDPLQNQKGIIPSPHLTSSKSELGGKKKKNPVNGAPSLAAKLRRNHACGMTYRFIAAPPQHRPLQRESSKVQHDLFQPMLWYHHTVAECCGCDWCDWGFTSLCVRSGCVCVCVWVLVVVGLKKTYGRV